MRTVAFLALALTAASAAPAFAQNLTLPAGSLQADEPPIDWRASQFAQPAPRAFEGRSVAVDGLTDGFYRPYQGSDAAR